METLDQMKARHAAERAALEAREALERDPWKDAIDAYWKELGVKPNEINRADTRKGLIAALPLAPIAAPVAMDEGADHSLCHVAGCSLADIPYQLASCGCLARVPVVAWPGDWPSAIRDQACTISLHGCDVTIACDERTEAEELLGWLIGDDMTSKPAEYGKVHADGSRSGGQPPAEPEWIDWHGGECPVIGGTRVKVRFRNGDRPRDADASSFWWGSENHPTDIIAYRILPEQGGAA